LRCLKQTPLISVHGGLLPAIANTSLSGYFSPAVDGVELTAPPEVYAEAGKLNNVSSVMLGTNLNEGRFLMPLIAPVPNGPNATVEDVKSWILANYGDLGRAVGLNSTALVAEVCKLYATELASTQPWKVASQIYTESEYLCPTERSARWLTSPPPAAPSPWKDNVFTYRLTYAPSNMIVNGEIIYWYAWCTDLIPCKNMTAEQVGVGHSSDVYLLFNRAKVGLNATDREVGHAMIDYWQGFAATGNPSVQGRAAWPAYSNGNSTMLLNTAPSPEPNIHTDRCSFWSSLHPVPYA